LPILNNVKRGNGKASALIVVPTRELGIQVAEELEKLAVGLELRVTAIYGGRPMEPQIAELKKGIDIIVGTLVASWICIAKKQWI
jgi:superfamily II DNA/RNA helicase